MAFTIPVVSFSVKVVGENTGEEYCGSFKTRPTLPFSLQLEEDRIRRELLGDRPESASARALNAASIIAFLDVHLTESPLWFRESGNGRTLLDDSVLGAIYGEAIGACNTFQAELKKKAEAAKKDLESLPTKE